MRKTQKAKTVLGLFLGGGRVTFAVARPGDASLAVAKQGSEAFALIPGQDDPEVIAAKLRDVLARHRTRTRHCVLALPLAWAVSARFAVEGMAPEALPEVAALELERLCGTPVFPDALVCVPPQGQDQALALTIEPNVARSLAEACRRAGLTPDCFVPAVAGMQAKPVPGIQVDVLPLPDEVDALVRRDGRPIALRQLALHRESPVQRRDECLKATLRSLQVTLSSLQGAEQQPVQIRVLGTGQCADEIVRALRERGDWQVEAPGAESLPSAEEAAAMAARADWTATDMLSLAPPERERRKHWWSAHTSRPLALAGAAVLLAFLAFIAAFVFRRLEVRRLETELATLAPQQKEAEALRDDLRLTAPWFSQTPEQLEVLRVVAESFPERGTVWVTELVVGVDGKVALTACARTQKSWLETYGELQKRTRDLSTIRTRQGTKAGEPTTFSVTFSLPGTTHGGRA